MKEIKVYMGKIRADNWQINLLNENSKVIGIIGSPQSDKPTPMEYISLVQLFSMLICYEKDTENYR